MNLHVSQILIITTPLIAPIHNMLRNYYSYNDAHANVNLN